MDPQRLKKEIKKLELNSFRFEGAQNILKLIAVEIDKVKSNNISKKSLGKLLQKLNTQIEHQKIKDQGALDFVKILFSNKTKPPSLLKEEFNLEEDSDFAEEESEFNDDEMPGDMKAFYGIDDEDEEEFDD